MQSTIYKIMAKRYSGGMYIMYKNGEAREVVIDFSPFLNSYDRSLLGMKFPFKEDELEVINNIPGFSYTELKPRSASDKIAAFCMAYRTHRNSPYTAKKNERNNIAQVSVTTKLLDVYFTNNEFPLNYAKSVSDYIRHYNHIRDIATNGAPIRTGFPDIYDRDYERTLDGEKLSAYRQHLIKLGWRKIDGSWTATDKHITQ